MKKSINYCGIEITVSNDCFPSFHVFFSNAQGNFNQLNGVKALVGFQSLDEGLEAGKKFVDEHQWQPVARVGIYQVLVRQWWDGTWGYLIRSDGSGESNVVSGGFEEAKEVGVARAQAKIEENKAEYARLEEMWRERQTPE